MKENNKMKKLMIAAAVAFAAVASQAATISWASANLYKASSKDGGWSGTSFKSGGIAATMKVFLIADAKEYETVSKMSAADMYAWAKEQTPAYPVANNSKSGGGYTSGITLYDEEGVANKWYNSIVLAEYTDADYGDMYMVTAKSKQANAQGNLDFTDIFGGSTPAYTGGWVSAVPEPTSGLLLLLGVAGLALRRRRA